MTTCSLFLCFFVSLFLCCLICKEQKGEEAAKNGDGKKVSANFFFFFLFLPFFFNYFWLERKKKQVCRDKGCWRDYVLENYEREEQFRSILFLFLCLFLFLFSFVFFFLTVQISVKFGVGKKKHKEDESLQRIASNFYVVIIRFQKKLSSLQRKLKTWRKKYNKSSSQPLPVVTGFVVCGI